MMSNKVYDRLKRLTQIVLPAVLTCLGVIGGTLEIPYTQEVIAIGTAIVTCLGTCLEISSHNYYKKEEK